MQLSKSKPNVRHKKILSANITHINDEKIFTSKKEPKENVPNELNGKEKDKISAINEQNNDNVNDNDSDIVNTSQVDWVQSVIEVKTKDNEIIKFSFDTDNCFEQQKIKVNKIPKFQGEKRDKTDNKNKDISKIEETNKIINKNDENKESANIMISTKDSEKMENNLNPLSNRKDFIAVSESNNIDEDIVNMNTITYYNKEPNFPNYNKNNLLANAIYKKRIKTGYLSSKNSQKGLIKPKILDTSNNNNNLSTNVKFYRNKVNEITTQFKSDYKLTSQNTNTFGNRNNANNNIHEFDNYNNDNNNIINVSLSNSKNKNSKKYITSYIYSKKGNHLVNNMKLNINECGLKKGLIFTYNKNKEISTNTSIEKAKKNNIVKSIFHNYQFITPGKSKLTNKNYNPVCKFIKKTVSHKYLTSSKNSKTNLLLNNFLSQIKMEKYYSILKSNGFDNINLLIEQMRTNIPIKDSELKKAGIKIPGDRAKILIRLEEKGNLFPFKVPKNVYYSLDINNNSIYKDENIINLKKWLKEFKMENYLNNFIRNGYYTVELFLLQMISKNPINNDILQNEIGIDKIGHRSRIFSILKEESKTIQEKLEKRESINIMDETKNCGCYIF